MKKFILPLMLLLFVGSMFAVESDPSEVVGYVKYDCLPGYNLVALPMVEAYTTTADVGNAYNAISDVIGLIYMYDASIQDWVASTNFGGGYWEPELAVQTGDVLYTYVNEAFAFYSIGDLPATPAQYTVLPGYNTAMIPLNRSDLTVTSQVGASMGTGEDIGVIYLYDASIQDWVASTNFGGGYWEPELDVAIGTPMYIYSNANLTWPSRSASPVFRSANN